MQIRIYVAALLCTAIAACGALAPAAPPSAPEANERSPRFVGLWAATAEMCADPAWRFAAHEVATQGEVHCAFTDVAEEGNRYRVEAMCTAEAPPTPYVIGLEPHDGVLSVSGGPWAAPIDLVYCAPLREN